MKVTWSRKKPMSLVEAILMCFLLLLNWSLSMFMSFTFRIPGSMFLLKDIGKSFRSL